MTEVDSRHKAILRERLIIAILPLVRPDTSPEEIIDHAKKFEDWILDRQTVVIDPVAEDEDEGDDE
jgi:hypothetical protein